jgi:hypothetical protein
VVSRPVANSAKLKRVLLLLPCLFITIVSLVYFAMLPSSQSMLYTKTNFNLVAACSNDYVKGVTLALSEGADPNTEHKGRSALWWAVHADSLGAVQILLASGANLNPRGQYGSVWQESQTRLTKTAGTPKHQEAKAISRLLLASGISATKTKGN